MDGKSVVTSRLFLVNAIATIAAVVDILTAGQLLPALWVPYIAAGVAVANVVLRVWFPETSPIASLLPQKNPSVR
jgi:hypothetical protein